MISADASNQIPPEIDETMRRLRSQTQTPNQIKSISISSSPPPPPPPPIKWNGIQHGAM